MLIAIDHGNYAIKTPHFSFVSHFLFSFPVNLCLLSLCVSIVDFARDSLNAKNAIGTLCW